MPKLATSNLVPESTQASAAVINPKGCAQVLLVCEHASNHIPDRYDGLGLTDAAKISHAAWDPGAQSVTEQISEILDAPAVIGTVSRLVYDCNRPPTSVGAIRAISEQIIVPGNADLTTAAQIERVETVYDPFTHTLTNTIEAFSSAPVLVTMHSFTRVYNGNTRMTDIGIIHDTDAGLAKAMIAMSDGAMGLKFALNEPYSKSDEVAHTLELHGTQNGLTNVMIEVCNDLIETPEEQGKIAQILADLLTAALNEMNKKIPPAGAV